MQISSEHHGDLVEMRLTGRLDNDWSGHLNSVIDEAVRAGSHSIVLDLSGISYLSSAGIGALIRAHKQFQAIHGFFGVGIAPPHVADIIRNTGLAPMLLCDIEQVRRQRGDVHSTIQSTYRVSVDTGMVFDAFDVDPKASFTCRVIGQPRISAGQGFSETDCQSIEFPGDSIGLGLGALGRDYADCANRFGEFLAVTGTVAQLPTSGGGKPDYQLGLGNFVPSVHMAYGVQCQGGFRHLYRFDAVDSHRSASLSSIVNQCLTFSEADQATFAMVAESDGLIGAALRRSPMSQQDPAGVSFAHPEIRRWLSFSPESVYSHTVALIVGVVARSATDVMRPLLRPLDAGATSFGHCHAAVFSYRPFKKRTLDLKGTVEALFETEELHSVLHLLRDDRSPNGGESQLVRGACWIGPISQVTGA